MILIDTSPLVALCSNQDEHHSKAVRELQQLAAKPLFTCKAVIMEAAFHLQRPSSRARLMNLLIKLNVRAISIADEMAYWRETIDWLAKYSDQIPDWADGCIAVLSGRDKQLRVWTFDAEFRTIWRRPDGSVIPMATK